MIGRVIWILVLAILVGLILWKVFKVYKEEKRNKVREELQDAVDNKALYKETAEEVKKQNTVKGGGKEDRAKVQKFVNENK